MISNGYTGWSRKKEVNKDQQEREREENNRQGTANEKKCCAIRILEGSQRPKKPKNELADKRCQERKDRPLTRKEIQKRGRSAEKHPSRDIQKGRPLERKEDGDKGVHGKELSGHRKIPALDSLLKDQKQTNFLLLVPKRCL